jgi:hypothetical protein
LLHILSSKPLQEDDSSICNAARAHSRLHKAAVSATTHVQLFKYSRLKLESLLLYLQRHQQFVSTAVLRGPYSTDPLQQMMLYDLPACLKVDKLVLMGWNVQLGPYSKGLEALLAGQSNIDSAAAALQRSRSGGGRVTKTLQTLEAGLNMHPAPAAAAAAAMAAVTGHQTGVVSRGCCKPSLL